MDFADGVVLAARVYGASRDRSGGLRLAHCVNVAQALGPTATATAMNAAVIHHIPEDSGCTIEDLATWGVDPMVCEVVDVGVEWVCGAAEGRLVMRESMNENYGI